MVSKTTLVLMGVTAVVLTTCATSYIARLPESNCSTSALSESWSEDRSYKATIQEKQCNAAQTLFYSVRVDAHESHGGWFATYDVEDDEYPSGPPNVQWEHPRTLRIDMKTRTLSGSIRQNAGEGLTIIQTYTAAAPNQFSFPTSE